MSYTTDLLFFRRVIVGEIIITCTSLVILGMIVCEFLFYLGHSPIATTSSPASSRSSTSRGATEDAARDMQASTLASLVTTMPPSSHRPLRNYRARQPMGMDAPQVNMSETSAGEDAHPVLQPQPLHGSRCRWGRRIGSGSGSGRSISSS